MDAPRRVLLIGKRASVLARLADALHAQGIEAEQVRELDGAGIEQRRGYDAVAFGRAVREPDRVRMRAAFTEANPEIAFVDGYAPIIPLLVAQFEQALDRRPRTARLLVDAAVRGGMVDLELRSRTRLRIASYRLGALYRTHERVVFDREADAGRTRPRSTPARPARAAPSW